MGSVEILIDFESASARLFVFAVLAWIPGLWLGPGTTSRERMMRVAAAVLLAGTIGGFLGPVTLESAVSLVPAVSVLFVSLAVLGEGVAGRGWPSAGGIGSMAYAAGLLLDLQERTGDRISVGAWGVVAVAAALCAICSQYFWRFVWRRMSRRRAVRPA